MQPMIINQISIIDFLDMDSEFHSKTDGWNGYPDNCQFVGPGDASIVMFIKCRIRIFPEKQVVNGNTPGCFYFFIRVGVPVQLQVNPLIIRHSFLVSPGIIAEDLAGILEPGIGSRDRPSGGIIGIG